MRQPWSADDHPPYSRIYFDDNVASSTADPTSLNSISYHEFHTNREFLSLYPPNPEEKDNLTSHCKQSQYVHDLFVVQDNILSHKIILLDEYHSTYVYHKFIATSSLRSS